MEYSKSNIFPKHDSEFMGAIFMCNALTKKECFRRKLFELPSVHSDFVKQIKTGMILFLFEPEERKLNGIFQATSDGAMNIVPSAFSISKKCFSAQVHFERLCACRPLLESEFSEAIEENYFTAIKFSFALSGQQVCRLIWLFSSRSYLPYDQLPAGLQSEFMKIFETSSLARTRATGYENLPKFDAVGYNMDSNIQPTKDSFLLGRSKNHLTSCTNHEHNDVTLHEPYPPIYHSAKLQQHNHMLSTSCNELKRESIPSGHPSYSSLMFPYQQPTVTLGTALLEQKLIFCRGSSLDAQTPHITKQSYASASHLGIKDCPSSNYPVIDISKSSRFSKPSQLTLHSPEGHVNFHDFSQKDFYDRYDLSKNNFLHSSPERLHAIASTSLLRNAQFNSRPIQLEDDSWNIQDWSSCPDYIPTAKGENFVNNGYIPISEAETCVYSDYIPILEGELAYYAKEPFDLPSRKENAPFALQYDCNSGLTSDTNYTGNGSFDFSYYDKNSVSDLNSFPQSHTIQRRCNVFHRLSRPPKKIKQISLDHMVDAFYHQRSHVAKYRKLKNIGNFETDVPLDDISELRPFENDSLVEIKPQIEELVEGNGFSFPNFRRRSVVKRQCSGESDFTGCVEKWKKRKIVRPSFGEDENSSKVKENCQNHNLPHAVPKGHDVHNNSCAVSNTGSIGSLDFRIDDSISKMPAEELSFSKDSSAAYGEGTMSVGHMGPILNNVQDATSLSNTDPLTVNYEGIQQTSDFDSEAGTDSKFVAKESEKINGYCPMRDENVNGKSKENSCALPLDYIPLSVEKAHEAIKSSSVSTSSAIASHGLPENDAAKNTTRISLDEDMSHIAVKMDAHDFPLGIRCKTVTTDSLCEDDMKKSDPETGSSPCIFFS